MHAFEKVNKTVSKVEDKFFENEYKQTVLLVDLIYIKARRHYPASLLELSNYRHLELLKALERSTIYKYPPQNYTTKM